MSWLSNFVNYRTDDEYYNINEDSSILNLNSIYKDETVIFPRNIYKKELLSESNYLSDPRDLESVYVVPTERNKDSRSVHTDLSSKFSYYTGNYFNYPNGHSAGRDYSFSAICNNRYPFVWLKEL